MNLSGPASAAKHGTRMPFTLVTTMKITEGHIEDKEVTKTQGKEEEMIRMR